jgi:hypothetical protein
VEISLNLFVCLIPGLDLKAKYQKCFSKERLNLIDILINLFVCLIAGLDLIVRDPNGLVLTPEMTSAVALYRQHVSRLKQFGSLNRLE